MYRSRFVFVLGIFFFVLTTCISYSSHVILVLFFSSNKLEKKHRSMYVKDASISSRRDAAARVVSTSEALIHGIRIKSETFTRQPSDIFAIQ